MLPSLGQGDKDKQTRETDGDRERDMERETFATPTVFLLGIFQSNNMHVVCV